MRSDKPGFSLLILFFILALLAGCIPQPSATPPSTNSSESPTVMPAATQTVAAASPTVTAAATAAPVPTATATPLVLRLWVSPAFPKPFRSTLALPSSVQAAMQRDSANLWLEIAPSASSASETQSAWIYAVVAPFPTTADQVSLEEIKAAWSGQPGTLSGSKPLLMSLETRQVLELVWGTPGEQGVRTVAAEDLLQTAWKEMPSLAILPFEQIEPRWKVLRINGQSPLDRDFAPTRYPLAVSIRLSGEEDALRAAPQIRLPTNRNPEKLTTLVMTGVTALSRDIALEMENQGILYPIAEIRPWLEQADLTHISNEVSFHSGCPQPAQGRGNQRFCSSPKYIELLEAAGTDIVELTGNHNLDWGPQPFLDSLAMYQQRGWLTFGGGANLAEAQQPVTVSHNGNRLAFLGCSPAGPEHVWATRESPGSAPCDLDLMEQQVTQLRADGYLPIVTFQAVESESYVPAVAQGMPNFRRMAQAGAVIVSGSQSHTPQTMTFVGSNFVHYGLGNLFFDQMSPLMARQSFIDRHIFYNGKYLGVELLTTLVEDLGRPRPMTADERTNLLETIFSLSQWPEP